MATSGSINYSLDARQLCTYALKKLREVGAGDTPSADDMAMALEELNVMLKGWQLSGPNLWRQTIGTATLVSSQASYTLSPRPFRVHEARYRDTAGRDIPMKELTRSEYYDLPLKTSTGIPTSYYVDYQRAAATLYVWPVLVTATTQTIQYTYQRYFEDLDSLSNEIDIPSEYLDVVGYNLADRLQDQFGKDDKRLTGRARYLLEMADSADREAVVRFEPGGY